MKKIISLTFALIFVLSLAACGKSKEEYMYYATYQSEEELNKEKIAVNRALQGGAWGISLSSLSYITIFKDGLFERSAVVNETILGSESGTYEIYPKSKEIVCTTIKGNTNQITYSYKYESNTLKLFNPKTKEYRGNSKYSIEILKNN